MALIFSPSITGSLGRVDRDLEFGLLIFLDAERPAADVAEVHDVHAIHAQLGVGRKVQLAFQAAEVVRGHRLSRRSCRPLGLQISTLNDLSA